MTVLEDQCDKYATGSVWGTLVAGIFALGIFGSYVPQQLAIFERKTTEGLSPYYLLLMNLGSGLSFANVAVLSRPIFGCCASDLSGFFCLSSLMGFFQIGAGFLGPIITLIIAYRFRNGPGSDSRKVAFSARVAISVNAVLLVVAVIVRSHHRQRALATACGLGAISVGLVQYLPQLWTTYHLKHTGSLSIATMAVQIPGGYLWCLSLARRAGSHWSTWLSLFMAASLQLVLLLMALYYSRFGKAVDRQDQDVDENHAHVEAERSSARPAEPAGASETSPLLGN